MIRVMTEQDVDRVYEIACASLSGDAWSKALLVSAVKNEHEYCIVCDIDGEVAGFAILSIAVDTADVEDIAVERDYRRRKIAEGLLGELITYGMSKGVREFALEVRESNSPAIALYKKNGFVTEAVRKAYYKNPAEDACIMWKRFV